MKFLNSVFEYSNTLIASENFEKLLKLYIEYDSEKLINFMKKARDNSGQPFCKNNDLFLLAYELCKNSNLYVEQAYLLLEQD